MVDNTFVLVAYLSVHGCGQCRVRPDQIYMTFVVDWALKTNYLSVKGDGIRKGSKYFC